MEGYKILCLVGEGSFGRVFKAKRRDTKEVVALKIIRKCGRSNKELLSLRSECEIQKHLQHRNIIKMMHSFETENEIVVVTEFCKRDLHYILSKQFCLTEEVTLPIVCDLVSALFYLHSNRVLHRDLKPQNVLITEDSVAKLCDFGFARSMSRGTHVLTSIKGTPLYMAPELIEESPYDHNADLWSLGCIVYEMLVGTPPFTTNSILQLVRMIRYEEVKWPVHLSVNATSFLRGLLHKDPSQRLSWPTLLKHPFLQDKVSSSIASCISQPLTQELSSSQALEKETQKQDLAKIGETHDQGLPQKIQRILDKEKKIMKDGACQAERQFSGGGGGLSAIDLQTLEQKLSLLKASAHFEAEPGSPPQTTANDASDTTDDDSTRAVTPLETEEWLAFLQQSMKEVMRGDVESMSEKSFITMVTNALTNHGSIPKISEHIACLLALPFVAPGVTKSELATIISVYIEVKVISSLIFAVKLLTNRGNSSASHDSQVESSKLTPDHLTALERVMVLVNQLIHSDQLFLSQLCDVAALLHLTPRLQLLFTLHRARPRIAMDLVAILTHILRQMPENSDIVNETFSSENSGFEWYQLMFLGNSTLQMRACLLMQLMAQYCVKTLQVLWSPKLCKFIHHLVYDSSLSLRNVAEDLVEILRELPFYNQAKDVESDDEESQ